MAKSDLSFLGKEVGTIPVRLSHRIIDLFSEGLYKSPTKAVEELVSNSFDAMAEHVYVFTSADLDADDATIAVIDDGEGMKEKDFRRHWLVGRSNKRSKEYLRTHGRNPIGKFGIGKLATYVLAEELTHVSCVNGKIFAATMDYRQIPKSDEVMPPPEESDEIKVILRSITEAQAKKILDPWLKRGVKLFGTGAPKSWTAAIMSSLKPMGRDLQIGRLQWILSTAMPVRDDFNVYLNSAAKRLAPTKESSLIKKWTLGKDIKAIGKHDLSVDIRRDLAEDDPERYGLLDPLLGRIWGQFSIYDDLLTTGKAAANRSYGYFVYVNKRLINIDDPYFNISSNLLRHGTLARFQMSVHIDKLDEELRSTREEVRESPLVRAAQKLLYDSFGIARSALEKHQEKSDPSGRLSDRIAGTPASLTSEPIIGLLVKSFAGEAKPRLLEMPTAPTKAKQAAILAAVRKRSDDKAFVTDTTFDDLERDSSFCSYDAETGVLTLNISHPFVAYFLDEYEDQRRNLPLTLFAIAEVVMEATLYQSGLEPEAVQSLMLNRDQLLRYSAKTSGNRNSAVIADALLEAANNKDGLEAELVAAFDRMGFDARPIGKKGEPDGVASAWLAGGRGYSVSLEAKSKESPGKPVSTKAVGISTVKRHRKDHGCDHAFVLAQKYASSLKEKSALSKEIQQDFRESKKTITCMRVVDFAELVRLQPLKRLTPLDIQELFKTCQLPEQAATWVANLRTRTVEEPPFKEILEAIYESQRENPSETVKYAAIQTILRKDHNIKMLEDDLRAACRALGQMAAPYVFASNTNVSLDSKPALVLERMRSYRGSEDPKKSNAPSGVTASKKAKRKRTRKLG